MVFIPGGTEFINLTQNFKLTEFYLDNFIVGIYSSISEASPRDFSEIGGV